LILIEAALAISASVHKQNGGISPAANLAGNYPSAAESQG
jgi:hypothetical protein